MYNRKNFSNKRHLSKYIYAADSGRGWPVESIEGTSPQLGEHTVKGNCRQALTHQLRRLPLYTTAQKGVIRFQG